MKKGVVSALSLLAGAAGGVIGAEKIIGNKTNEIQKLSDKHLDLFLLMNQWVKVKQEGKRLSTFFKENGYNKIAIYGMSNVGETLIRELKESDIQILYGIDRNADSIFSDIDVVTPESLKDEVDAVVVTAISFFDEIEEMLSEKVSCPILSLEDILYEV